MMQSVILVALGGAVGAVLRYGVGLWVLFPFGTLAVNIVGAFLIGIAFVLLVERGLDRWALFAVMGLLGGFTTFSAFSLDVFKLVEAGRMAMAGGYVVASVLLSLIAVFAAIGLMRALT